MIDERYLVILKAALDYEVRDPYHHHSPAGDRVLTEALAALSESEVGALRRAASTIAVVAKHHELLIAEARRRESAPYHCLPGDDVPGIAANLSKGGKRLILDARPNQHGAWTFQAATWNVLRVLNERELAVPVGWPYVQEFGLAPYAAMLTELGLAVRKKLDKPN